MRRRAFLMSTAFLAFGTRPGRAQPTARPLRIGILSPGAPALPKSDIFLDSIVPALREIGYIQGRNLVFERRYAHGKPDRLPELARDLVRHDVDVIVAVTGGAVRAARGVTSRIPIIMGFAGDPVGNGFAESLARPGGNITGVVYSPDDVALWPKRLELLREAVPKATRIALLTTSEPGQNVLMQKTQGAAATLGIELVIVELIASDYARAFAAMGAKRVDALLPVSSPILFRDRRQIIDLAAKRRLPTIYEWREAVAEGGLMSYGASLVQMYGRVASYVVRIVQGANPAELPIEQPAKFELVINMKTAKAIGLTLPPSLLLRADEIIQ